MRSSIELRVPFASKDIVQYMYNVPWKYMYEGGREKGLLRDAFKDFLPDDIYDRKKNPYLSYDNNFCNRLNFMKYQVKTPFSYFKNGVYDITWKLIFLNLMEYLSTPPHIHNHSRYT